MEAGASGPAGGFPHTRRTWIQSTLMARSGPAELREYLVDAYYVPLEVFAHHHLSRCGDPAELVQGFFAASVLHPGYLLRWHACGMQLRWWLANGLRFHALGERRRWQQRQLAGAVADDPITCDETPERAFERSLAQSLGRMARERARRECERRGLHHHWCAFIQHALDGDAYPVVAARVGVDAARARVMARTAAGYFRRSLRELLMRDGVPASQIDAAIGELLDAIAVAGAPQ